MHATCGQKALTATSPRKHVSSFKQCLLYDKYALEAMYAAIHQVDRTGQINLHSTKNNQRLALVRVAAFTSLRNVRTNSHLA